MSEHEPSAGETDEWYTPPEIFTSLNLRFDLDPCSPGLDHWVPAEKVMTKSEDGLNQEWNGTVFMNPPFGSRNGQVPWLKKFIEHGDGIAVVAARTSSKWYQELVPLCDAKLFPLGKTKFIRPDGSRGKSPGTGVVLLAKGEKCVEALRRSKLGFYLEIKQAEHTS